MEIFFPEGIVKLNSPDLLVTVPYFSKLTETFSIGLLLPSKTFPLIVAVCDETKLVKIPKNKRKNNFVFKV